MLPCKLDFEQTQGSVLFGGLINRPIALHPSDTQIQDIYNMARSLAILVWCHQLRFRRSLLQRRRRRTSLRCRPQPVDFAACQASWTLSMSTSLCGARNRCDRVHTLHRHRERHVGCDPLIWISPPTPFGYSCPMECASVAPHGQFQLATPATPMNTWAPVTHGMPTKK